MTDADTLAAVRAHVAARLDALGRRPGTWGDPEATELQYLQLLDVAYVLARPDDARPRVVVDSYVAFLQRELPPRCTLAARTLAGLGRDDELLPLLARFRAHVEARLAATETPAIVREACAACGMALDRGRHPWDARDGYGCPHGTP